LLHPGEARRAARGKPHWHTGAASGRQRKNAAQAAGNLPRVIYFDFDSFVVKEEFRGTVEAHAKLLSADRKRRLAIEGHTDERGGREYNLALGQKRAEAVAKSLTLLGATDVQIEAVSFGKERPAVQGSDEAAWAKNRRAELNSR
jgi:peptidoglycan-associated lipoprotein